MKRLSKKVTVFCGGTCNESTWRDRLIPELEKINILAYNPVVENWNEEAQKREIYEREHDDFVLYTITPLMLGCYSIAELTADAIIRSKKTIVCLLEKDDGKEFDEAQWKSLKQVGEMAKNNGAFVCYKLDDIIKYLKEK